MARRRAGLMIAAELMGAQKERP
jgi:hypothetical protein